MGRAGGVDRITHPVDNNMMVIPAKCGEVVRVVVPALRAGNDVMYLKVVAVTTGVSGAASVAGQHMATYPRRDHISSAAHSAYLSIFESDVEGDRSVA